METVFTIADSDLILRHIPGGPSYQQPPELRITSKNFHLRPGESGVSVTCAAITSPETFMAIVGGNPEAGSKIAAAQVSDIRGIGLSVVSAPTAADPGHAEIRSDTADLNSLAVRRELAQLFRFVAAT
jgi:hypothetical protein